MRLHKSVLVALPAILIGWPASAHHGKDFLLIQTDDMPLLGHVYAILSADTNIDQDGAHSTEVTPGFLLAVGKRLAIEPHFHESRSSGNDWHYDASAIDIRYASGPLPGSEWRTAVAFEAEKPKDAEEPKNGQLRIVLARTFPNALVAVNLIAGREFVRGGQRNYGLGVGALTPLPNGDRAGVEAMLRFPLADGVEVVPGYYHSQGNTSLKIGVGLFRNRDTTSGTLHASAIQRF